MTLADLTFQFAAPAPSIVAPANPRWRRRSALLTAILAGAAWGSFGTGLEETTTAVTRAGGDLVHLLRFMALLKAAMALGAAAALWWRLGAAVPPVRLAAYLLAGAAMGAGPGLIWGMAHVGPGALLLHGGLLAALLLLWRDPAVAQMLGEAVAARQRRLAIPGALPGTRALLRRGSGPEERSAERGTDDGGDPDVHRSRGIGKARTSPV